MEEVIISRLKIKDVSDKLMLTEHIGTAEDVNIWRSIDGTKLGVTYKGKRLMVDLTPVLQEMVDLVSREDIL